MFFIPLRESEARSIRCRPPVHLGFIVDSFRKHIDDQNMFSPTAASNVAYAAAPYGGLTVRVQQMFHTHLRLGVHRSKRLSRII